MPLSAEDRIVEEIFLSPRIVDSATYEELAGALRTLVRRAAEQRNQLSEVMETAGASVAQVGDAMAQLKAAVGPAARLLPTLDDRVSQARATIDRLADPSALASGVLERAMDDVDRSVRAHAADLSDRTLKQLDAQLLERSQAADAAAAARAAQLLATADGLEQRAQRAEQRLASAEASLAAAVRAAEASVASITRRAIGEQVNAVLTASVAEAEQQAQAHLRALSNGIERRLAEQVARADEAAALCQAAAGQIHEQLEQASKDAMHKALAELETSASDLRASCAQAQAQTQEALSQARERAAEIHGVLLEQLNGTAEQAVRFAERTDDGLTGLEARAASISDRLARRIDDLAADADMVAQDAARRTPAGVHASIATNRRLIDASALPARERVAATDSTSGTPTRAVSAHERVSKPKARTTRSTKAAATRSTDQDAKNDQDAKKATGSVSRVMNEKPAREDRAGEEAA